MTRLVLFDLDGTLLRSHNGFIPFNQAIETTFGIPGDIRTIVPDGNTDPVILEEIFAAGKVDIKITKEQWEAFAENLHQSYARSIQQGLTRFIPLPGVLELVKELEEREGVYQGVVTGNLEVTGRLKLDTVGLSPYLKLGAYGSDSPTRRDLPRIAKERWERAIGVSLRDEHCMIVGDTPRDLDAARQNRMKCLLVGTGRYPVEELELLQPDATLADLTDTKAALGALLS